MSKIGIRCDCGPIMGMGHILRQKLIYSELVELGHQVFFFVEKGRDIAESIGVPLSDQRFLNSMDILIIDLVSDFKNYDFPKTKVVFYDGPEIFECNADFVFALNHKQQKSWYKGKSYFVGLDYIPMDPDIVKVEKKYNDLDKILIMTSGVDEWNMPKQILNAIKDLGYQISIKLSSAYPENWVKGLEKYSNIIYRVNDISFLYEGYDLMICTAGNVLFEAAAAGLPCITFSTGIVQDGHGIYMRDEGFSVHLGGFWDGTDKVWQLPDVINSFVDRSERIQRSERGRSLCDGKGLERIISIIG